MKRNKWLMFIVLYITALAIGLNQFKVPPIMAQLAEVFNVSITSVAWLMSIFTVAGVILAIPSAMILAKVGTKKLGIYLMVFLGLGSLMGGLANSYTMILISRAIEGIGFALIILLGIVLINTWFKPEESGIPTGIFLTFPAVAPFVMFNVAGKIAASAGWNSLWFIGAAIAGIALVLFALFIETPEDQSVSVAAEAENISIIEGLCNGKALLLGILQGAVAFILFAFLTIYPQIFTAHYGLDIAQANFYGSLSGLFGIFTCIVSGIIIDKTQKPELLNLVSFIGLTIATALTFKLTASTYVIHILFVSVFTGLVIPSVLTVAPSVAKKPQLIGYAVALVNQIYFIGVLIGAPVVTSVVASNNGSWSSATLPLVGVSLLGAIVSVIFMFLKKDRMVA